MEDQRDGTEANLAAQAGSESGEELVTDELALGAAGAEGIEQSGADGHQRAADEHEGDVVAHDCN